MSKPKVMQYTRHGIEDEDFYVRADHYFDLRAENERQRAVRDAARDYIAWQNERRDNGVGELEAKGRLVAALEAAEENS
jgi:hypothetical protein